MLSEITHQEIIEWMVFGELEPFDEERADVRAAAIRSTLANVNRKSNRSKVFTPEDFMLHFGDSKPMRRKKSGAELLAIGKSIAMMFGATVRKMKK